MRSRSNLCTIQSYWNTEGGKKWSETSVTIIFLCLCRADFGETEVAFSDERHGAGFPFSLLVSRITAGLIETCRRTFITSVRFYYLFSSLAERSLSTCHMEGWMNNKGRATNNSSCLLRSLRVTWWPVCMFGRPPGPATFSLQILPVYVPESADLLERQHAHSHLRWQVPPEFGLEVSVSDLVLLTQQRNRFPPHVDAPCPFLLLLPPNGVLGGRSSPSITITYLNRSQRAPVPDTQYPSIGTRPDSTWNKPTAQLVILRERLERISGGINHYEAHSSF